MLMNPFLEALSVERDVTLLAAEEGLHVLLPLQAALPAVLPLRLPCLVQLCGDDPVLEAIKPRLANKRRPLPV